MIYLYNRYQASRKLCPFNNFHFEKSRSWNQDQDIARDGRRRLCENSQLSDDQMIRKYLSVLHNCYG